ncbi:MAG: hypothetical protein RR235_04970 [Oscillospiraceae bacterium]
MGKVVLSASDIEKAKSYMPLLNKAAVARAMAPACVETVKLGTEDRLSPIPDRAQENTMTRERGLMGVFVRFYLNLEWEGWEEDILIPVNIYDDFMGSHIFGQLERMKSNARLRDKVFDMLSDYRRFQSMLGTEIATLIAHKNDVAARLLSVIYSQTTSESMSGAMEELERLKNEAKTRGDTNA